MFHCNTEYLILVTYITQAIQPCSRRISYACRSKYLCQLMWPPGYEYKQIIIVLCVHNLWWLVLSGKNKKLFSSHWVNHYLRVTPTAYSHSQCSHYYIDPNKKIYLQSLHKSFNVNKELKLTVKLKTIKLNNRLKIIYQFWGVETAIRVLNFNEQFIFW